MRLALTASAAVLPMVALFAFVSRVQVVSGVVHDATGSPVSGAVVRVKATSSSTLTDAGGKFTLGGFAPAFRVRVTGWQDGYYIDGADAWPWNTTVELVLSSYRQPDRNDYVWQPPSAPTRSAPAAWLIQRSLDLAAAVSVGSLFKPLSDRVELGCRDCHAAIYEEWSESAHSRGVENARFMTMYNGTNIGGDQSPLTRYVSNRDYGRMPVRADLRRPYFGPGFKLDFPNIAGNCASCHLPTLVAENTPYADPNLASGLDARGTHCDFCHKISDVVLAPGTGAPYDNRTGVLSIELMRPASDSELVFGPYDDVDFGRDTYLPLIEQSEVCAPCHAARFWGVPIYQSFNEWRASSYSAEGKTCQSCHMKPDGVTTNFAPQRGGVERDPHSIPTHTFPGANDQALLQDAAELAIVTTREDDHLVVDVSVTNAKAGHHLPTGSPLRHVLLVVTATDEHGQALPLETGPALPGWTGDLAGSPGVYFAKILEQLWTGQVPTGSYWTPTRLVEDARVSIPRQSRGL